ncbi:MAG TPA: hypothetical protein VFH61_02550 [Thermoleophilia bacterium]|nr:hypothetical protein [Thermoleophilia bacterium]
MKTAVHRVYAGQSGVPLAKTVIKNNGSEPVTDFRISDKIPSYAEIAGQEDHPVILPGQTVDDYCCPTFDAAQIKAIETETQAKFNVNYTYDGSTGPKGTRNSSPSWATTTLSAPTFRRRIGWPSTTAPGRQRSRGCSLRGRPQVRRRLLQDRRHRPRPLPHAAIAAVRASSRGA